MNMQQIMGQMTKGQTNAMGMPIFQQQQPISINQNQFKSYLPKIGENDWRQLIQMARSQGISDNDIETGLQMIQKMR